MTLNHWGTGFSRPSVTCWFLRLSRPTVAAPHYYWAGVDRNSPRLFMNVRINVFIFPLVSKDIGILFHVGEYQCIRTIPSKHKYNCILESTIFCVYWCNRIHINQWVSIIWVPNTNMPNSDVLSAIDCSVISFTYLCTCGQHVLMAHSWVRPELPEALRLNQTMPSRFQIVGVDVGHEVLALTMHRPSPPSRFSPPVHHRHRVNPFWTLMSSVPCAWCRQRQRKIARPIVAHWTTNT